MNDTDVHWLLEQPNKCVVRPFAWQKQHSGHVPEIYFFDSTIMIGNQVPEGLLVRASYRGQKTIRKGMAEVKHPEKFECALLLKNQRIAAIDTNPGQKHTNRVGAGLAYYGQTLTSATHRHIWTGEYGYVEPVEPPLLDVVELLKTFAFEYHLCFKGTFSHPLAGVQGDLL